MTNTSSTWLSILEDNSGGLSTMRVVFIFATVFLLTIWGTVCYQNQKLEPIPNDATTIILGLAGVKMVQRFGEKGITESTVNPDPPKTT
jgi:hypothetical protein